MQQPPDVTSVTSAVSSAASAPSREEDSASITSDNSGPIKTLLQNLLGGNNNDKSREEMERERKWSEWMAFGRKVQESNGGSDSTSTSDVSLDESLLSVEKGADYVVVAVPAEAADGVGPILSSFPGGKLFQKTIGKTFQEKGRRTISNSNSNSNSNNKKKTLLKSKNFVSKNTTGNINACAIWVESPPWIGDTTFSICPVLRYCEMCAVPWRGCLHGRRCGAFFTSG